MRAIRRPADGSVGDIVTLRSILFSFEGRLGRMAYWLSVLGMVLGAAAGGFLFFALIFVAPIVAMLLVVALFLPLVWIGLAVGAKRLHDRDRSAGWLLAFYLLPSLLGQIASRLAYTPSGETMGLLLSIVGAGLALWGIVELGFLRGTEGANRFGPAPESRNRGRG